MKIEFKLLPPTMPNFISYETPPGKREDGFNPEKNSIAVADLTPEQALEYGHLMADEFIRHWKIKKSQKSNS